MPKIPKTQIVQAYQRRFRHFSLAYKVALGVVLVICAVCAFVVDRVARTQLNDTYLINMAGNLRLNSAQAVQAVQTMTDDRQEEKERTAAKRDLKQLLTKWESGQKKLLEFADKEGQDELKNALVYAGAFYKTISERGNEVLAGEQLSPRKMRSFKTNQRLYSSSQDLVARKLRSYHSEKISGLNQFQLACSALVVLILFVEGIWLFKPLLKGLQDSFDQIEEHHAELDAIRVQLAEQNENLVANENSLSHALARAEDMSRLSRYAAARFEELFAGLSIAAFTFDCEGNVFEWNRECESLFGIPAHLIVGRTLSSMPSKPICPDDYREMVDQVFRGEHLYDLEQNIRRNAKDERIGLCNTFPLRDPDGRITGGVCVVFDVTEARLEERRIAESETRFRTSMDSLQSGILFMDHRKKITQCNPRAAEIMGLTIKEVLKRAPQTPKMDYIHEDGSPMLPEELPLMVAFRERRTVVDMVMGIRRPDGTEVFISVNASPVQLPGTEEPLGSVASFTDITLLRAQQRQLRQEVKKTSDQAAALEVRTVELTMANEKLEALATTDGLTGLHNHRHFQESLERSFATARRTGRPLSLIMLDVDHFKKYNDAYGHPAGDEVLRSVGRALASVARASDIVARYGGEEFVIILADTDEKGAAEAAERYREAIEIQEWSHRSVTASLGVATLVPEDFDRAKLITLADAALYESKRNGRNRCTHADNLLRAA